MPITAKICLLFLPGILTFFPLLAQTPDFTPSVTSGCPPLAVTFTANAPGAISCSWNFGNGGGATGLTPSRVYSASGTYTVTLTVTYASGPPVTITKNNLIHVYPAPQADFSANPQTVCVGVPVAFSNQTSTGGSSLTSSGWDFGDGGTSSQPNPQHTYQQVGTYSVTLSVTDANGCKDTRTKPAYIQVTAAPDAGFSASQQTLCGVPSSVTLFPNAPGGTHTWTVASQTNPATSPSFTISAPGTYSVTHTISLPGGCTATQTYSGYITVISTNLTLQATPGTVCAGTPVSLVASAPGGGAVSWNFGGGAGSASSSGSASVVYMTGGVYQVTASVQAGACTASGATAILVHPRPVPSFTVSDTVLCEDPFTLTVTNTTPNVNSVFWNLNSSPVMPNITPAIFSTPSVTYTYPKPATGYLNGTYHLYLRVTDGNGCQADRIRQVSIGETLARAMRFPKSGCAPLWVNFNDLSISGSSITAWQWDFGDGSGSTQQHPSHLYQNPGTYTVTLIINTLHGCSDTLVWPAMVKAGAKPVANFVADTLEACASRAINFTNLSIPVPDSSFWSFGDGFTAQNTNPSHIYRDTGYQHVSLISFDRGCPDTLTRLSYVYIKAPIANFSQDQVTGCQVPFTVTFTDHSLVPHRWHWDFGTGIAGDTSNQPNPSFTFTQAGSFFVQLTVFNDSTGCSFSTSAPTSINPAEAEFLPSPASGCAPLVVSFTDQSVQPVIWQWDFDNGNTSTLPKPLPEIYTTPGIYHPTLLIKNGTGCTGLFTTEIRVLRPEVNFSFADTAMCAPATPAITNTTASVAPVTSWSWTMGTLGTSSQQTPVYTFPSGVHSITLTATDTAGCTGTQTRPAYFYALAPVADFIAPYPVNCPDNPMTFNAISPGPGLYQYQWDFGDGSTGYGLHPQKVYASPGTYTVTLSVMDNEGCADTMVKPAYASISEPVIDFTGAPLSAPCPSLLSSFTFLPQSVHPFSQFSWSFGTGGTSQFANPSHLYTLPGSYTVTLTATDAAGCSDAVMKPAMVNIGGPSGSFTFSPGAVCPHEPVVFTAITANADTIKLDMNDGMVTNGSSATHSYTLPGIYYPLLLLTDAAGCKVGYPAPTPLVVHQPPVASFVVSDSVVCDSGLVTFLSTSTSSSAIIASEWQLPNATVLNGLIVSQLYHGTGSIEATLTVTNAYGCKDTISKPAAVTIVSSPEAWILADTTQGCVSFIPHLRDSVLATSPILTHAWSLSNGWQSVPLPMPPAPVLSVAGDYTAQLIVTDIHGCDDTATLPLKAHPLPVPDFYLPQQMGCAPLTAAFENYTWSTPPTRFLWDFGDGGSSTDSTPVHTYTSNGLLTVKLTATNGFGCTDSIVKPAYVDLQNPEASFEADSLHICPGTPVTFAATASGHAPISSYLWDFGDGTQVQGNPGVQHTYTTSGTYTVSLTATDVLGCGTTFTRPMLIMVKRDDAPEAVQIRRVTVLDDATIRIEWNRYRGDSALFDTYRLMRTDATGNTALVMTSSRESDTVWTDTGISPVSQVYCYSLEVENECGRKAPQTDAHCSIETQTNAIPDLNLVSWTPYTGWNPERYQVYRVTGYGAPGELLGEVPGSVQDFADTLLYCNTPVSYRITALGKEAWQLSRSDTARAHAIHSPPHLAANVLNGTIADNADAEVVWEIPPVRAAVQVMLERRLYGAISDQWRWSFQTMPAMPWKDQGIQAQDHWYTYHLRVVDVCQDSTPEGAYGQTIRLKATKSPQDEAVIKWNPYTGWPQGVIRYEVERWDEQAGKFLPLVAVSPATTTWRDTMDYDQSFTNCYRVRAFGTGGEEQISLSNEDCVTLESVVWAPNTFSPNGDGANETFYFPGKYVGSLTMKIVDRWGELLYESSGVRPEWDGMYNGQPAPEGVYMYLITGTGLDGQWFDLSGWVLLIR